LTCHAHKTYDCVADNKGFDLNFNYNYYTLFTQRIKLYDSDRSMYSVFETIILKNLSKTFQFDTCICINRHDFTWQNFRHIWTAYGDKKFYFIISVSHYYILFLRNKLLLLIMHWTNVWNTIFNTRYDAINTIKTNYINLT
jgi:hypothetical protein